MNITLLCSAVSCKFCRNSRNENTFIAMFFALLLSRGSIPARPQRSLAVVKAQNAVSDNRTALVLVAVVGNLVSLP